MSVSRRSLIAETWVRFQASFNGNRGNQSSNEAFASCTRSIPSMSYRTIVAIFSVVDLGAVARQCCRWNTAPVQLHLPDFRIYLCWLQRCSPLYENYPPHDSFDIPTLCGASNNQSFYPSLSFPLHFSTLCAQSRYQVAISVAVFPCIPL